MKLRCFVAPVRRPNPVDILLTAAFVVGFVMVGCDSKETILNVDTPDGGVEVERDRIDGGISVEVGE